MALSIDITKDFFYQQGEKRGEQIGEKHGLRIGEKRKVLEIASQLIKKDWVNS